MKILVVEDCRTTRRLLGIYLRSGGYEVLFAENGLEALERLAAEGADLVMTDLNMPYMDGLELTRTLKSDPALSGIPVIVITTDQDAEEREGALAAGADRYVVKPVTAEMISQHVHELLTRGFARGGGSNG